MIGDWRNETARDVGAHSDDDTWRREVSFLSEFERALSCGHIRQTTQRFCPDCGRDIKAEL